MEKRLKFPNIKYAEEMTDCSSAVQQNHTSKAKYNKIQMVLKNRHGANSEMRMDHDTYDMKYGQPMVMHIQPKRGLHVKDINKNTRNAFHKTLATMSVEPHAAKWAGGRKDM